jgi:hypothetical protein
VCGQRERIIKKKKDGTQGLEVSSDPHMLYYASNKTQIKGRKLESKRKQGFCPFCFLAAQEGAFSL